LEGGKDLQVIGIEPKIYNEFPLYVVPRAKCNDKVIEDEYIAEEEKKGKGCKTDALNEQFEISNYRSAINEGTTQMAHNIKNIRSFGFKSYLSKRTKKVFNGFDDKRYTLRYIGI